MSDPKEQQREPEELDLDAETVTDLELDDTTADMVEGGMRSYPSACATGC